MGADTNEYSTVDYLLSELEKMERQLTINKIYMKKKQKKAKKEGIYWTETYNLHTFCKDCDFERIARWWKFCPICGHEYE